MRIRNILIKNFRNIKEINLDFTSNSNKSEYDVKWNSFQELGGGKILPNVIGLIGPNSVGKTNILDGIQLLGNILNGLIDEAVIRKILKSLDKNKKHITKEEIEQYKEKYEKETVQYEHIYKQSTNEIYIKEAYDLNNPIEFEITLFHSTKEIIKIKIMNEELIIDNWELWNKSDYKIVSLNKTDFYLEESGLFNFDKKSPMTGMILKLPIEKSLSLLQIADPNIKKIEKNEVNNIVIYLNSGNKIDVSKLSTGTKIFFHIASSIYNTIKMGDGIYLIDGIDTFMHRELAESLLIFMNMISNKNKNITFIFTTHNLSIMIDSIKNKQIFEILNVDELGIHKVRKLSSFMKQHENIDSKYRNGVINPFPSKSYFYDNLLKVLDSE